MRPAGEAATYRARVLRRGLPGHGGEPKSSGACPGS